MVSLARPQPNRSKPSPWPITQGRAGREWRWFWSHAEMVLPMWENTTNMRDVVRGRVPVAVDGNPTTPIGRYGRVLDGNTGDRLRYTPGATVPFDKDLRWSCGIICERRDLQTDESTIWAKSSNTPTSNAPRQIWIASNTGTPPNTIAVKRDTGPSVQTMITTGSVMNEDTPYLMVLTCDGAEGLTFFVYDLLNGSMVVDGDTGTLAANEDTTHEIHLMSHYSSTNDDSDGEDSIWFYLNGLTMNRSQVMQVCRRPFGMLVPTWANVPLLGATVPAGGAQTITLTPVTRSHFAVAPVVAGTGSAPISPSPVGRSMIGVGPAVAGTGSAPVTLTPVTRSHVANPPATILAHQFITLSPVTRSHVAVAPTAANVTGFTLAPVTRSHVTVAPVVAGTGSASISPSPVTRSHVANAPTVAGTGSASVTLVSVTRSHVPVAPATILAHQLIVLAAVTRSMIAVSPTIANTLSAALFNLSASARSASLTANSRSDTLSANDRS